MFVNTFICHKGQNQNNNKRIKYWKRNKRNTTIKTTTYSNIQNTKKHTDMTTIKPLQHIIIFIIMLFS